jgi:hypothetical protein
VSFRAVLGGAPADGKLIGMFACDASLNIASVKGEITDRLDCLPSELKGYGWQPFVQPADFGVTLMMAGELQAGRAGQYDLRAQARTGDPILHIRIRTFIVRSKIGEPTVHGTLDLRHSESRRTITLPPLRA